jgi:hypothetical protein
MTTVADGFRMMDEFFSSPSKWVQKVSYRSIDGIDYPSDDQVKKDGISCACMFGVVQYLMLTQKINWDIRDNMLKIMADLGRQKAAHSFIIWNDTPGRKFEDVKKFIDEATKIAVDKYETS